METVKRYVDGLFFLAGMVIHFRGVSFILKDWRIEHKMMKRLNESDELDQMIDDEPDESEVDQMIDSEDIEIGLGREEKKKVLLLVVRSVCMVGMCMACTMIGKGFSLFILGIWVYCIAKGRLERNRKEWEEMTE